MQISKASHSTSKSLFRLSAGELLALLRTGQCSAQQAVESCLERIDAREPVVQAFVQVDRPGALRRARELDRITPSAPLHGLPVAIKETIDVAGLRCTLGSSIHGSRIGPSDAAAVRRLRELGAVIVGTTVSTEYAIARAGGTRNPYDSGRTPGGSSSGSGAAVAAGMVPLALGTQTVGSIVRPATYCGIFGMKPTFGAIDATGCMPLSGRLDHVGPMARHAADLMLAFNLLCDTELTSRVEPKGRLPRRALLIDDPLREHRDLPATRDALERAQASLQGRGIVVQSATLPPRFSEARRCWETILFRDIARHHGADRDAHGDLMSERLRSIIDAGRAISDTDYQRAVAAAEVLRRDLCDLIAPDAIIAAPAVDDVAPAFSEATGPSQLQGLWTLVGFPAIAVPCGMVDGLPIGVQLIGAPGADQPLLAAAALFTAHGPAV